MCNYFPTHPSTIRRPSSWPYADVFCLRTPMTKQSGCTPPRPRALHPRLLPLGGNPGTNTVSVVLVCACGHSRFRRHPGSRTRASARTRKAVRNLHTPSKADTAPFPALIRALKSGVPCVLFRQAHSLNASKRHGEVGGQLKQTPFSPRTLNSPVRARN